MASNLGVILDGRFDLRRQVGLGAMGIVYEALDVETGQRCAVKILRVGSQSGAQRFMREGTILAELDHPAIVRYVTHGTSPHGETYLVMEWLAGEPPFTGANAMAILCKICLEEAPRLSKLLPQVPMQLDVLVNSMLAKDPASRPRDTVMLASALASIAGSSPPLEKRAPPRVTLTQGEQRVLCAIFVRGAATDPEQSFSDLTAT